MSQMTGMALMGLAIVGMGRTLYKAYLLKTNPEAWKALKAKEDAKAEKWYQALGGVTVNGIKIVRLFLRTFGG